MMKATIDERGMLIISAETKLEAYALRKYSDDIIASTMPDDFPLCIETEI